MRFGNFFSSGREKKETRKPASKPGKAGGFFQSSGGMIGSEPKSEFADEKEKRKAGFKAAGLTSVTGFDPSIVILLEGGREELEDRLWKRLEALLDTSSQEALEAAKAAKGIEGRGRVFPCRDDVLYRQGLIPEATNFPTLFKSVEYRLSYLLNLGDHELLAVWFLCEEARGIFEGPTISRDTARESFFITHNNNTPEFTRYLIERGRRFLLFKTWARLQRAIAEPSLLDLSEERQIELASALTDELKRKNERRPNRWVRQQIERAEKKLAGVLAALEKQKQREADAQAKKQEAQKQEDMSRMEDLLPAQVNRRLYQQYRDLHAEILGWQH